MTTDRELLEMAAKAAGYEVRWEVYEQCYVHGPMWLFRGGHKETWEPLDDDGDALRLAVKLKMTVDVTDEASGAGAIGFKWCSEINKDEPLSAARRAIVRAAAEIGRAMK